jgi:hypothetical protein
MDIGDVTPSILSRADALTDHYLKTHSKQIIKLQSLIRAKKARQHLQLLKQQSLAGASKYFC